MEYPLYFIPYGYGTDGEWLGVISGTDPPQYDLQDGDVMQMEVMLQDNRGKGLSVYRTLEIQDGTILQS